MKGTGSLAETNGLAFLGNQGVPNERHFYLKSFQVHELHQNATVMPLTQTRL
jgi:hypothetical protein